MLAYKLVFLSLSVIAPVFFPLLQCKHGRPASGGNQWGIKTSGLISLADRCVSGWNSSEAFYVLRRQCTTAQKCVYVHREIYKWPDKCDARRRTGRPSTSSADEKILQWRTGEFTIDQVVCYLQTRITALCFSLVCTAREASMFALKQH